MAKNAQKGRIGIRSKDGVISDVALHAEIMDGVDDTPLRRLSAIKTMRQFGLTQAEAESLFKVEITEANTNRDLPK